MNERREGSYSLVAERIVGGNPAGWAAKQNQNPSPSFGHQAGAWPRSRLVLGRKLPISRFRGASMINGAEIAELMDVNHTVVQCAIRKLAQSEPGLALGKRLIAKNRLPEVLLLMAQGLPPASIAERFGVDRASMARFLYKLRRRAKTRGGLVNHWAVLPKGPTFHAPRGNPL
jgi:hypothetical protein